MKTSVIEVRDMLSVLTVDDVEKRFCEVPGIKSATVNFAAGSATVRYDETLLEVAEIRILVHQRGQQPAGESPPKDANEDKSAQQHAEGSMPAAAADTTSVPKSVVAKDALPAPDPTPAPAAAVPEAQKAKPAPGAPTSPAGTSSSNKMS